MTNTFVAHTTSIAVQADYMPWGLVQYIHKQIYQISAREVKPKEFTFTQKQHYQ